MSISSDDHRLEKLVQKFDPGARLLRAWALTGGVSAQVLALEVEQGGETRKYVARWHGDADLAGNPNIARDEFLLLRRLHLDGLPVPAPYGFDVSGEIFARPYIIVEYVEGVTEFAPANLPDYLNQFAETLTKIHGITVSSPTDFYFLPKQAALTAEQLGTRPAELDESLEEGRIRAALEAAYPFPKSNAPALLHGDYWVGNILWKNRQLAAVIDWEDARTGDPLAELGNSRLEVLWAFGMSAMHDFTRRYLALQPTLDATSLPYWDLVAALRPMHKLSLWAGSAEREHAMREGHSQFVAQAFKELG
jgi:aminoglycoside phosphotransferase (APT) family kinase protein